MHLSENQKPGYRISLLGAIVASSIAGSLLVFALGLFVARPFLVDHVRGLVRGHQAAIEDFFSDSISQQLLVGDGPDVLRKCHSLLRKDYVRAVYIKDLGGEVICDLKKGDDGYALRWSSAPIYFDEAKTEVATVVQLAFSTEAEDRLIWTALIAAFAGAALLLIFQVAFTIPLSRRILRPLADISSAVTVNNPEDIELPDLKQYRPLVVEVRAIFFSMQTFLKHFQLYKSQLIESTRFEAVARTVQIIAHDLKAPMASFERLTRIPDSQFHQERKHLVQALQQLYSMTDAIKHAEFEDVVRMREDDLDLTLMQQHCQSIGEKLGKALTFEGPLVVPEVIIDQPKLIRALSNLVINALEAAHSQAHVTIRQAADELMILVADDGSGVPEALQERLFTRGATMGKVQGTGLGLNYARRVAEGHGGTICYERKENWTTFRVNIPCEKPSTERVRAESPPPPSDPEPPSKCFLLVMADSERAETLRSRLSASDIDIFLPHEYEKFREKTYRYIFCEDWELAAELRPLHQKVLGDPTDPLEKVLLVLNRFRNRA